jgi:hypothetical protein
MNPKSIDHNVYAGALFIAFGLGSAYLASGYGFGTTVQMGAGYFPTVVGWTTVGLGVLILARGLVGGHEPLGPVPIRPVACVIGGIVLFGVCVDRLGLVIATLVLITVTRLGGSEQIKLKEMVAQIVVLTAGTIVIFVYALRLPMKLWP